MGKWIYRIHEHDTPRITYELYTKPGDKWQCKCGQVFEVTSISRGQSSDYGTGKPYLNLTFMEEGENDE